MANHAKAQIVGRLCRDWELRYTANNIPVATNTIAASHKYKDRETKLFLKVTAWQKSAEVLNEYTRKGSSLFLEVRLQTEEWTAKDGGKRSEVTGVIETFEFLDSKGGAQSESRASQGSRVDDGPHEHAAIDSEDIPFLPDGIQGKAWLP